MLQLAMPVNLAPPDKLLPVPGTYLACLAAGIYKDRRDLVLIGLAEGSTVAGVFTKNAFCAAPVTLCKAHLQETGSRYLLINAGNANAGTGSQGMDNARLCCQMVAEQTACEANQVLPFSTGVIGEQLPMDKFEAAIPQAATSLSADNWNDAAETIITTDTIAKGISKQMNIGGQTITITGISKGSGMINPNMATMLAYVATDAKVESKLLQNVIEQATDMSFNAITVDSDTSTNDSLILMATGQSGAMITDNNIAEFQQAINEVCLHLAQAIIRDGEGATKFVTIDVTEAKDEAEAKTIAYSVAHSPLVKTALFASDPNWGRLLMAVGKTDIVDLDVNKISLWLGKTQLLESGEPAANYTEALGQLEMAKEEITIRINLARGSANTKVWTSDLSHEYVRINAEYRS